MLILMNGKVVKVAQYNMEFGGKDRYVNLIACFKYIPNGNIYLVYNDVDDKYGIVYYGSGHIKGNSALCMQCRSKEEVEIIKEYLFKISTGEEMDGIGEFAMDDVETLEIISSDKLEVKLDVLNVVIDKKIPKVKKEDTEVSGKKTKKKRRGLKLFLLLIIAGGMGGYIYINLPKPDNNTVTKSITCSKVYNHNELDAKVKEVNKYNFDINENLLVVDTTMTYQFDKETYDDFVLKGTYYKYMPDDGTLVDTENDSENYKFIVSTKVNVNSAYQEPTKYEEVLRYYESDKYKCDEEIEK